MPIYKPKRQLFGGGSVTTCFHTLVLSVVDGIQICNIPDTGQTKKFFTVPLHAKILYRTFLLDFQRVNKITLNNQISMIIQTTFQNNQLKGNYL